MQPVIAGGSWLEYDERGSGDPIVFIHGSLVADAFEPLLREPALVERYQRISYHRRGFAGSAHPNRPISVAEQAEDCQELLRQLRVARAHFVGYAFGGLIALQLALAAPKAVGSLALLEPPLLDVPGGSAFAKQMVPALTKYEAEDKRGAVDHFLRLVFGEGHRTWLDTALPTAFDQAVADADSLFLLEWPALLDWAFGPAEARSIAQPVLAVLGANSATVTRIFPEGHRLLRIWLPQAEPFVLARATHGLQLQNPSDLAAALSAFLARHPLSGSRKTRSPGGESRPDRR